MYLKRIGLLHHHAKQRLHDEQQQAMSEILIDAFADVVEQSEATNRLAQEEKDAALGKHVRQIITANGEAEKLKMECEMRQAYHNNNYLPLLHHYYRRDRGLPFRLMTQLRVRSTTKSQALIQALDFIKEYQNKRGSHLPPEISIEFAGPRWQTFIREKVDGEVAFIKHHLEICVFSHIADGLRNGDLYVESTETYADYRTQLLSWAECQAILDEYCTAVGLLATAADFVKNLRQRFIQLAKRVDKAQAEDSDLYFDSDGKPHLHQLVRQPSPEKAEELEAIMKAKMPERHLLDILHHVHHWVRYTRHFGPPSGSDPKMCCTIWLKKDTT